MRKKNAPRSGPKKAKLYIVDDHPIFREGLASIIRQQPGLTICGEADTAAKAFDEIRRLKPDILLTDIGLPGKSGLELLKDLHAFEPSLPVLVISMHDETLYAERVLHAGGRGYIMKQEGPEKILVAIARVLAGQVYVSDRMSAGILERISRPGAASSDSPIGKLTDREFEVLRLIGEGKDGHDIARALHLSLKTVHCHRANIRQKLGLKSGAAIVHFASRWVNEQ
ncbi:MAG: response regulator transcription factor [Chthoniobacteraceae bacterium]